jgi:CHAT domain
MELIVRFTREASLPNAKSSSISPAQIGGSDETYLAAWATSDEEMSSIPITQGASTTLPAWSSERSSKGTSADWLWKLIPPDAREAIERAADPVQLMVESGSQAVDFLPWESLPSLKPNMSRLSVSRLVPSILKPPPLTVVPPLRVLLITSEAEDDLAFGARDRVALRDSMDPQSYEVCEARAATETSAIAIVRNFDPHIVHFMGHGGIVGGEGAVALRDEKTGLTNWIRASQVSPSLPISTRLLCMSTGFTQQNYDINGLVSFAHAPQAVRLPTCIVNRSVVDEAGVKCFWSAFYSALVAERGSVLKAYNAAIAKLARAATATPAESFSLVLRDGGDRPLRFGKTIDPVQHAAEVQAQFAARLAADLKDKLKSYENTDASKVLNESYAEERTRFTTFSSTAASFDSE